MAEVEREKKQDFFFFLKSKRFADWQDLKREKKFLGKLLKTARKKEWNKKELSKKKSVETEQR